MSFRLKIVPLNKRTEQIARENELIVDTVHGNIGVSTVNSNGDKIYNSAIEQAKTDLHGLKILDKNITNKLANMTYGSENNVTNKDFTLDSALENRDILGSLQYLLDIYKEFIDYYDEDGNDTVYNSEAFKYIDDLNDIQYGKKGTEYYLNTFKNFITDVYINELNTQEDTNEQIEVTDSPDFRFDKLNRLIYDIIPFLVDVESKIVLIEKYIDIVNKELGTDGYSGNIFNRMENIKNELKKLNYKMKATKFKNFSFLEKKLDPEDKKNFYKNNYPYYKDYNEFKLNDERSILVKDENGSISIDNTNYTRYYTINEFKVLETIQENFSDNFEKYFISNPFDPNYDGDLNIHQYDGFYNLNYFDFSNITDYYDNTNTKKIKYAKALRRATQGSYINVTNQIYLYPNSFTLNENRFLVLDPVTKLPTYKYRTMDNKPDYYDQNDTHIYGHFPLLESYNIPNNELIKNNLTSIGNTNSLYYLTKENGNYKDYILPTFSKLQNSNYNYLTGSQKIDVFQLAKNYEIKNYNPETGAYDKTKMQEENYYFVVKDRLDIDYHTKEYEYADNVHSTSGYQTTGIRNERYGDPITNDADEYNKMNANNVLVNYYYKAFNPFIKINGNPNYNYDYMIQTINQYNNDYESFKDSVFSESISKIIDTNYNQNLVFPNIYNTDFAIKSDGFNIDHYDNTLNKYYIINLHEKLNDSNHGTYEIVKIFNEDGSLDTDTPVPTSSTTSGITTITIPNIRYKESIGTIKFKYKKDFTIMDALKDISDYYNGVSNSSISGYSITVLDN